MPAGIGEILSVFETALDEHPVRYETVIAAFRELTVPTDVSAEELTRLYKICYRILDFDSGGFTDQLRTDMDNWKAGHLEACAQSGIENTLYDRNAQGRSFIQESIAGFKERGEEVPEELIDNELPPKLNIPWDKQTASKRIHPILVQLERRLKDIPTAHFDLSWKVTRDGYPVFNDIITKWMVDIEQRGIGMPGTVEAFNTAQELLVKAEADCPISWNDCERDVIPLLEHAHPMIAGGAARYLGSLFEEHDFTDESDTPLLAAMLDKLSDFDRFRAIVCGGFVCGFDSDFEGLYSLVNSDRAKESGFDIDKWILKVVAHDDYEPYLPNAQPLWFYVHEYYDNDPAMVMKFIDLDRSWLAMMCATEVNGPVDGMKPILQHLAGNTDDQISEHAKSHLAAHY